jgi:hypothetical protein
VFRFVVGRGADLPFGTMLTQSQTDAISSPIPLRELNTSRVMFQWMRTTW